MYVCTPGFGLGPSRVWAVSSKVPRMTLVGSPQGQAERGLTVREDHWPEWDPGMAGGTTSRRVGRQSLEKAMRYNFEGEGYAVQF